MNDANGAIIAEGFLNGAFDVIDAMLSLAFTREAAPPRRVNESDMAEFAKRCPVVLSAMLGSGGAAALMLSVDDAARFAALVMSEAPVAKSALDDADLATLREIAEPCLGGGFTNLMERFGRNVEQPENVEVAVRGASDADLLSAMFEMASEFRFTAQPDIDSSGVLLLSDSLEALVPGPEAADSETPQSAPSAPVQLSEAEMSDILSGFGTSPAAGPAPAPQARPATPVPPNLDMVLDIRLVATARMGRVEMPISEILNLGPGSIIPVGHLVDEPVELLVNDRLIARGDVVVVDEKFGLRITEIVSAKERIESLH